jgi:hypothetical protein
MRLVPLHPGKPELLLSEHFHEAVRGVRKRAGLSAITAGLYKLNPVYT